MPFDRIFKDKYAGSLPENASVVRTLFDLFFFSGSFQSPLLYTRHSGAFGTSGWHREMVQYHSEGPGWSTYFHSSLDAQQHAEVVSRHHPVFVVPRTWQINQLEDFHTVGYGEGKNKIAFLVFSSEHRTHLKFTPSQ